jgi:preprotein translocase subunit SecB
MADSPPGVPPNGAPTGVPQPPSYSLVSQYMRDLSFENPNAPGSVLAGNTQPQFNVSINVGVRKQNDEMYAVELTLNAKAEREGSVLFNVELVYGALFRVRNATEQTLPPLLMVECPRMIFPFARHALANVIQIGGFPPVMMEPVDFYALYVQNLRKLQSQQQQQAIPADATKN